MPDLRQILESYDGKSVDPFRLVSETLSPSEENLAQLAQLAESGPRKVQIGSTWVIKHFLETGVRPDADTAARLVELLARVEQNESALHLLQSLPYLELPPDSRAPLDRRLRQLIHADSTFVRAWAYNGLAVLARLEPDHRDEVRDFLSQALESERPAVKARIRNALKTL
jgi:hypothetical protein